MSNPTFVFTLSLFFSNILEEWYWIGVVQLVQRHVVLCRVVGVIITKECKLFQQSWDSESLPKPNLKSSPNLCDQIFFFFASHFSFLTNHTSIFCQFFVYLSFLKKLPKWTGNHPPTGRDRSCINIQPCNLIKSTDF